MTRSKKKTACELGSDEAAYQKTNFKRNHSLVGEIIKAPPQQTTDPLRGWFSLGRNVKPRRAWKGGRP